jgi:Flp pilus assembly protein TadD
LALFGIVARTLRMPRLVERYGRHAELLAFVIAIIWVIHPLQTQSVTYIIQRCESLMGLCYLLSLYCVIRGARAARGWPWYVAGAVAVWLGTGCKEVMVTAAFVIPLYDRIFLANSWREVFRKRWGFYLAFVPAIAWVVYIVLRMGAAANAGFAYKGVSPLEYLCSQPNVLLHYLRLAVLPDRLCLDYGWKPVEHWWQFVPAGLVILTLLIASLVAALRYRSPAGFLGVAFFLILAPTSSFMPIADLAFEHRMYLPLACVITLLVFAAVYMANLFVESPRSRKIAYTLAVTMLVAMLMVRTFVRNRLYTVPLALWSNVLNAAPDNVRAHVNYGHHLAQNGHLNDAIAHHYKALELAPDDVMAHDNLAKLLAHTGHPKEALQHFLRVRELRPKWGSPHYHVGILLLSDGQVDRALISLHKADEIKPDYPGCLYRLGVAYRQKGDYDRALDYLRRADRGRPDHVQTVLAMAKTLSLIGDVDGAQKLYRRALELTPDSEQAKKQLAELRQRQDKQAHHSPDNRPPATRAPTEADAAAMPAAGVPAAS